MKSTPSSSHPLCVILNLAAGLIILSCVLVAIVSTATNSIGSSVSTAVGGVILALVLLAISEGLRLLNKIVATNSQSLFFYVAHNELRGPVSLNDLETMRALNSKPALVTESTMVCQQGTAVWLRLSEALNQE